jgi:hypothetical protein
MPADFVTQAKSRALYSNFASLFTPTVRDGNPQEGHTSVAPPATLEDDVEAVVAASTLGYESHGSFPNALHVNSLRYHHGSGIELARATISPDQPENLPSAQSSVPPPEAANVSRRATPRHEADMRSIEIEIKECRRLLKGSPILDGYEGLKQRISGLATRQYPNVRWLEKRRCHAQGQVAHIQRDLQRWRVALEIPHEPVIMDTSERRFIHIKEHVGFILMQGITLKILLLLVTKSLRSSCSRASFVPFSSVSRAHSLTSSCPLSSWW